MKKLNKEYYIINNTIIMINIITINFNVAII